MYRHFKFCFLILFFWGCSNSRSSNPSKPQTRGEYIFRHHDDKSLVNIEPMTALKKPLYPWEEGIEYAHPKITKDYFRCRGNGLNPVRLYQKEKEVIRFYDCGGPQKHSLPLRNQKEFVYPILIDLLNYIQLETGCRVVVTCGHCCPEHNSYLNPDRSNQTSKHMLGAEVDFYVQGMEEEPEKIVELIFSYYRDKPKYKGMNEYIEFKRYEKGEQMIKTAPWYNKEVFIKLLKKSEGRDFDNRHSYPYICLQVRYDWDNKEQVIFSWEKAFHQLHRW